MDTSFFIFENSAWWTLLILLVAVGVAWLQYTKKDVPWSRQMNVMLAILRGLGIGAVAFLLLNPLINQLQRRTEQPAVVVAVDNSSSMLFASDSLQLMQAIERVEATIDDQGYIPVRKLLKESGEQDTLRFDATTTDLTGLLNEIQQDFEGKNLGAIVLLSDGIYNRGMSPVFRKSIQPVYTLGVGDSLPQTDLKLVEIKTNRVAYQGNLFPVDVRISGSGYEGRQVPVTLSSRGEVLATELVLLEPATTVRFEVEAEEAGLKRYTVSIPIQESEKIRENNQQDFFIEIVEGKERVLLVSTAPHPDIRVLRQAIEQSENYETHIHIPGIETYDPNLDYDVVIAHNVGVRGYPDLKIKGEPAYWYIPGTSSSFAFLSECCGINLVTKRGQSDAVRTALNERFGKFILKDETNSFSDFPTIDVPFGEYSIGGPVEVLIYQKVGSIVSSRPLFTFYDDGDSRSALLLGQGIWKWRLQEAAIHDNTSTFDQMVLKTIQYLSVRNDQRRFFFEPIQQFYQSGEDIRFRSESYNDVYERIGGNEIIVTLTDESEVAASFNFTANPMNNIFSVGTLPKGVYSYEAETFVGNTHIRDNGEFIVEQQQLENLNLTSNRQLLREISTRTGARYADISDIEVLENELSAMDLKGIIHSSQSFLPLINLALILVILMLLFSVEWFFRKYLGSY